MLYQKKEELGLFTEPEAIKIFEAIYALKDEEDMIYKTNEKNGTEDWISGK